MPKVDIGAMVILALVIAVSILLANWVSGKIATKV